MASLPAFRLSRTQIRILESLPIRCGHGRYQSTLGASHAIEVGTQTKLTQPLSTSPPIAFTTSPLARLSTKSILRSLFLSVFFTSPLLFRPGFAVFRAIANSKNAILNPDKNPILRALIRPVIYDQFCAGRNKEEIHETSSEIKRLGFSGIVLCYGKEVQISADGKFLGYAGLESVTMQEEIQQWREGYMKTLEMVSEGDWLGIKMTGAGLHITKALVDGSEIPPEFSKAIQAICAEAQAKGCRIWMDAEQQIVQPTIDKWTWDLMRQFNKPGKQALLYNTVQAYLKSSREKVQHQLALGREQGWRPAIKLVRGAYISIDQRNLIHDLKSNTDVSYDGIVHDLLTGTNFPVLSQTSSTGEKSAPFEFDLLLAGHNTATIREASRLASSLSAEGTICVKPEFAQLQGMADDIGCELLQTADEVKQNNSHLPSNVFVPKVYKCLTWGSVQECMQYLTRRLVENRGAADRMLEGGREFKKELWRRMFGRA